MCTATTPCVPLKPCQFTPIPEVPMHQTNTSSIISSLLFCCAASVSFATLAQTEPSNDATIATIISPIDTTSLKGRMASAEKAARERAAAQAAAENTPTPRQAMKSSSQKATPARVKSVSVKSKKPIVIRGDEFSYRHRGMLKERAYGENRYGGSTFTLKSETLVVDHADALAGFISFDNLGTLRERKIYRANGNAEVRTYDQHSGDVIDTTTEKLREADDLTAGGISVMPGISFGLLVKNHAGSGDDSDAAP